MNIWDVFVGIVKQLAFNHLLLPVLVSIIISNLLLHTPLVNTSGDEDWKVRHIISSNSG